jgi:hypothetical protein
MTHAHIVGGRDFQSASGDYYGSLGFSEIVTATLQNETQHPQWPQLIGIKLADHFVFSISVSDTKPLGVSDTRVSDTEICPKATAGAACSEQANGKSQGIVNSIDNSEAPFSQKTKRRRRCKRPKNRKRVFTKNHFEHEGDYYELGNTTKAGNTIPIYVEIMNKGIDQMKAGFSIHGRLFVQHIVLSTAYYTDDNTKMTGFRKSLIQMLQRQYAAKQTAYIWAREIKTSDTQHYHMFFAVDGQKIWAKDGITTEIKKIVARSDYFTKVCMSSYRRVRNEEEFKDMIFHLSYIAKIEGKGFRHPRANDFASSNLKANNIKEAA